MTDDLGLIADTAHQHLARDQSAWCIVKNYSMARELMRRFADTHQETYQYVFPHHTILKPQPETKRETQRHTFVRFITPDSRPEVVRGSEAIIWMPMGIPYSHPNYDEWMRTQQLMKKWEVKA